MARFVPGAAPQESSGDFSESTGYEAG